MIQLTFPTHNFQSRMGSEYSDCDSQTFKMKDQLPKQTIFRVVSLLGSTIDNM